MAHRNISIRQLQLQINRHVFENVLKGRMKGPKPRVFSFRNQFDFLLFAMLNEERSLRSAVDALNAHQNKFYHLGFKKELSLSTISEANSTRSYEPYEELFQILRSDLDRKYRKKLNQIDMNIIDSTMFTFSDKRISWAKYSSKTKALKIHLMLDESNSTPKQASITTGKSSDVKSLDRFTFDKGSLYVMDRAYLDCKRLYKLHIDEVFFIVRMKSNLIYHTISSKMIEGVENVLEEKKIQFMGEDSKAYGENLRAITIFDPNKTETFDVITNHPEITVQEIADFYKRRWGIEMFFRWLKRVLGVLYFYGRSENAMKMQIWIALILCILLWQLHRQPEWKKYSALGFLRRFRALLFLPWENPNSKKPPPERHQISLFGEKFT